LIRFPQVNTGCADEFNTSTADDKAVGDITLLHVGVPDSNEGLTRGEAIHLHKAAARNLAQAVKVIKGRISRRGVKIVPALFFKYVSTKPPSRADVVITVACLWPRQPGNEGKGG
jgi:hypothetical protein